MRLIVRIGLGLLLVWLLAAAVASLWARGYMQQPIATLEQPTAISVPVGASLARVAQELASRGLLSRPVVFVYWARLSDLATRIQAGEYLLEPGLTPAGLLQQLVDGRVRLHPVTLVEGWTLREIGSALHGNPVLTATLSFESAEDMARELALDVPHAEGMFLPETYYVPRGTTDVAVLKQAATLLQQELAVVWESRAPDLPLESPYELLILASIIERETGLSAERAEIAGVFVRRLNINMRLQTDPTVIYGIGAEFDGNITRRHLTTDTPYNTYTRGGLPPTPIAIAGRGALQAAANPAPGKSLFFVASGKGDGSHVFSVTLEEHNAAVASYLEQLRRNRQRQQQQQQPRE